MRLRSNYLAVMLYRSTHLLLDRFDDLEDKVKKQMSWTKRDRHKTTGKKLAESKKEIKKRVGESPDFADGFVLFFNRPVTEKVYGGNGDIGSGVIDLPELPDPYRDME